MDRYDISPEHLPVSLGYAMIIQAFDAYDGNPPECVKDCINTLFGLVPKEVIGAYPSEFLFQRMLLVGGYIENIENQECVQTLKQLLLIIQEALQTLQKSQVILDTVLGVNAAFVAGILDKRIHLH